MPRRLAPFVVALALLLAGEPLLHSHPFSAGNDGGLAAAAGACAVCATGIGGLPLAAPAIDQPTRVVASVVAIAVVCPPVAPPLSLPSRAPPAV